MIVPRLRRNAPRTPGATARTSGSVMIVATVLACFLGLAPGQGTADAAARRAAVAMIALQTRFGAGTYVQAQSWQSANALQATVDYMRATGSRAYLRDLDKTYQAHHDSDRFLDHYYDDEGWWALTWLSAYQLTHQARYLEEAEDIFADMASGWDSTCGGGIWWNKSRTYKNAIANELFLETAARLHRETGEATYAQWAQREWAWFTGTGMLTPGHLVVDGLANCKPVLDSPTWTYNQGVLIGALTALARSGGPGAALVTARRTADAVISSAALSPRGILREPCEETGTCGSDGRLFKGIFARSLKHLDEQVHDPRYRAFLQANAAAVWANDRRGGNFGLHWNGPFDTADTAGQVAALDILTTQLS